LALETLKLEERYQSRRAPACRCEVAAGVPALPDAPGADARALRAAERELAEARHALAGAAVRPAGGLGGPSGRVKRLSR